MNTDVEEPKKQRERGERPIVGTTDSIPNEQGGLYMKVFILVGSLILTLSVASTATAAPVFDGVAGIVIWVFLGYCAAIAVALVFAALITLRRIFEEMSKKTVSKKIWLR